MKDLEKEVSLDERDAVAGGVPDMEDIASDIETDCDCDGSDGPAHVVRDRHPSPVPRKRQR